MIELNKPYLDKNRLCVKIIENDNEKLLWYETDEEYKEYFCVDRLDGVLITLLLYAMKKGEDIICYEKVSEKLYYQITNFLIPTLAQNIREYKNIKIKAELCTDIINSNNAVGTGISCGVDSFYTIFSNLNNKTKNFNITYLTCFNVGGNGSYGGEKARSLFKERVKNAKDFSKSIGMEVITVDSNVSEIIQMLNIETHSFRQMAIPLLLQKMFKKYYYSSGMDFNTFKIEKSDTAYFDLLNVHCFSTENLDFYSTGGELKRIEKLKFISEYPETYSYLNVCIKDGDNCSKCEKCIRTMLGLYSIGKLEKYKDVFNVDEFYRHITWNLSIVIKNKKDLFYAEIYEELKKNKIKISIRSYIIGYLKRIKKILMRKK